MTNLHMTDHNILEKTKTGQKSKNRAESPKKTSITILSFQFKLGSRHLTFAK